MKRFIILGLDAVAASLCLLSGFSFCERLNDYTILKKDINRQRNEISALEFEEDRHSPQVTAQSASETVNSFSSQIADFKLEKASLLSEISAPASNGWDEWRIEAECSGSFENILAFIDSLETAGIYQNLNLSLNTNDAGLYDLNIKLNFYARHE